MSEPLELISKLRADLAEIWRRANSDGDTTAAFERARRWHERAVRSLGKSVSETEARRLNGKVLRSLQMGNPMGNLQRELQMYDAVLQALAEEIERDPAVIRRGQITDIEEPAASPQQRLDPQKVFIVHGHDEANTMRLESMLKERFNLHPVVMSGAPGRGRTLIEKFEQLATECSFAFVLLTPDDAVDIGGGEYTQARPNVVFELGWFYGRLGRERVVMLVKEGTRMHSDLDGVSRIQFIRSVDEKIHELEKELSAAGLPVAAT